MMVKKKNDVFKGLPHCISRIKQDDLPKIIQKHDTTAHDHKPPWIVLPGCKGTGDSYFKCAIVS